MLPCVDAVAVRTQEPEIALVCSPILEAVIPSARTPGLFASVDVVDVQNPVIVFSAFDASAAKLIHKRKLPAPVAWMLVDGVAVFVPVIDTALFRAKTVFTSFTATLAGCLPLPPRRKVTCPVAVFPCAIFEAVKMGFKRLRAVGASHFDSGFFHSLNIACGRKITKYFDIACRRIEQAQRQGDLFINGVAA